MYLLWYLVERGGLVRTCEIECSYDGVPTRTMPLSSHPAIQLTDKAWDEAARRLAAHETIPAYVTFALDAASRGGNIRRLYEFVKAAKGGELFYQDYGKGADEHYDRQRKRIHDLPELRNKLLHEGTTTIPEGAAVDALLTVLNAIDWLFA